MNKMTYLALPLALPMAFFGFGTAIAQEIPAPVTAWYSALRSADAPAFEALLAPGATIELKQLGVTQTREEFLESLDSWEDAVKGAEITAKPAAGDTTGTVFNVCYKFPSNERLNRETFVFAGEKISAQAQETVAESCAGSL